MLTFISKHPLALLIALAFHGAILASILWGQPVEDKVIKVKLVSAPHNEQVEANQSKDKTLRTFAVDGKQVKLALAKIKKEEADKLKKQKNLAAQTRKEKKKLAELKQKQKQERANVNEQRKKAQAEKRKAEAEKRKADIAKRQADIERQKVAHQKQRADAERKKAEKAKREAKLAEKQKAEAKKVRAQEEAKTKKLAETIKRKNLEKKRLEKENAAAAVKRQLDEEESLQREMAKEEEMLNLKTAYISNIASQVTKNWKSAAKVSEKAECRISVTQTPTGNVSSVKVHSCNKFATTQFKKDAEKAVYRSEPLPKPPVKELFERNITFVFHP